MNTTNGFTTPCLQIADRRRRRHLEATTRRPSDLFAGRVSTKITCQFWTRGPAVVVVDVGVFVSRA